MKLEPSSQFYHMDGPTKTCDSYITVSQSTEVNKCDRNTNLDQN